MHLGVWLLLWLLAPSATDEGAARNIPKFSMMCAAQDAPAYINSDSPGKFVNIYEIVDARFTNVLLFYSEADQFQSATCISGIDTVVQVPGVRLYKINVGETDSPLRTSLEYQVTPSLFIVPPWSVVNNGLLYKENQLLELVDDREAMLKELREAMVRKIVLSDERPNVSSIQRLLEIPNQFR